MPSREKAPLVYPNIKINTNSTCIFWIGIILSKKVCIRQLVNSYLHLNFYIFEFSITDILTFSFCTMRGKIYFMLNITTSLPIKTQKYFPQNFVVFIGSNNY